jgi:elongator complex protein 2
LTSPPLEDHLSRYTLSPELEKIYAHASELITVSVSHSGNYIASACKASTTEAAAIRVFDVNAHAIAVLKGHNLTVANLVWSPDDGYLISVGRDRHWIKWNTKTWTIVKDQEKAHARIIWDVSYAPAEFGDIFITASRDGFCKMWEGEKLVGQVKFGEAVTACAFAPWINSGTAIVAVGLDNGDIYVLGCMKESTNWKTLVTFDKRYDFRELMSLMVG